MSNLEVLTNEIFDFFVEKTLQRCTIPPGAYKNYKAKIETVYKKYFEYFEKLAKVCSVTSIDYVDYIQYVFTNTPLKYRVWPKNLCNIDTIKRYAEEKDIENQYEKLIAYFKKTYDFLHMRAIENSVSITQYFKELVKDGKLINYVMSGDISRYWLVTLGKKNLQKIIKFIADPSSKITFGKIIEKYDVYASAIAAAYMKKYGKKVNPFEFG